MSSPYPHAWPNLAISSPQAQCVAFEGVFSDIGHAAGENAIALQHNPETAVSLSGLLITGNEQARAFARSARVNSTLSCQTSVDLIETSVADVPTHLRQSKKSGSHLRIPAATQATSDALSAGNIQFEFLEAIDGSLIVKEIVRHADVEALFVPSEEVFVQWFRFPLADQQGS